MTYVLKTAPRQGEMVSCGHRPALRKEKFCSRKETENYLTSAVLAIWLSFEGEPFNLPAIALVALSLIRFEGDITLVNKPASLI